MGVNLTKNQKRTTTNGTEKKPVKEFRRVATVVTQINKLNNEKEHLAVMPDGSPTVRGRRGSTILIEGVADDLSKEHKPLIWSTPTKPVVEEDDEDLHLNSSRNLVFKDTSAAWAALMRGEESTITELPSTELLVVDSALGGTRTIERTNVKRQGSAKSTVSSNLDKESEQNDEEYAEIPYIQPSDWETQISSDMSCAVCNMFTGEAVAPCRVCVKVYHRTCLLKIGHLNGDTAKEMLEKAHTDIGWSCHECENLASLLNDEDMMELMDIFERCDVDQDATIDMEEFLKYRRAAVHEENHREMTQAEIKSEEDQFRAMDTDLGGSISWWEFLNHETLRRLSTQPKKKLFKLLKPKEIHQARQMFRAFDSDKNGFISEFEARQAYKEWYSNFTPTTGEMDWSERQRNSHKLENLDKELKIHVDTNTEILMSADTDHSGTISWEEFITEQALYILAARPNHGPVQLHCRAPFFMKL